MPSGTIVSSEPYMNKSNDAPAEDYVLIPEGAVEDLALSSESVAQLFSAAEVA